MQTCLQIWQRNFQSTFTALNPSYSISPIRIWRKQLILAWKALSFLSFKLNEAYGNHEDMHFGQPNQTLPGFPMTWICSYSGIGNASIMKELGFVILYLILSCASHPSDACAGMCSRTKLITFYFGMQACILNSRNPRHSSSRKDFQAYMSFSYLH